MYFWTYNYSFNRLIDALLLDVQWMFVLVVGDHRSLEFLAIECPYNSHCHHRWSQKYVAGGHPEVLAAERSYPERSGEAVFYSCRRNQGQGRSHYVSTYNMQILPKLFQMSVSNSTVFMENNFNVKIIARIACSKTWLNWRFSDPILVFFRRGDSFQEENS